MSIADKLLLTKKRMEESKEFTTLYSPQPPSVGFGANTESHGTMLHGAPRFLPDRPSPNTLSTGGFQSSSHGVHVPDLTSATTSLKQSHVNETQPAAAIIKSSTRPLERDSPLLTLPHTEAAHFRLDARSTGPAYLTQVRATSAEYAPVRTPTTSVQSTSASTVKLGETNKLLDHTPVKFEGAYEVETIQTSHQVMRSQDTQATVIQAAPGNLLIGHQPSQGLTYVHANPYFTNHNDIAKRVQNVLQQKVSDHPNWSPPSIDYMNKPLNCQICKITINDVESLLVCDACERGTHLKCLQSYGNKGIPKAEWHCPKCLIQSNGKPLPPKYGRVTRTIGPSKASSNTVGTHASSEKRAENPESKVNHQKSICNGNSGMPYVEHASSMVTNPSELASDSKAMTAREMEGLGLLAAGMEKEDGMYTGTTTFQAKERNEMVCVTPGTQSESSDRQVENTGLSPPGIQISTSESMESKIVSEQSCSEYPHDSFEITPQFQAPGDSQACNGIELTSSIQVSANQLHEIDEPSTDESKPCGLKETPEYKGDCDIRPHDQENSQPIPNGASDNGDVAIDCGMPSLSDLHTVDWVGDILDALDGKTYYQSCRINGALHKLHDHVLISCNGRILVPSKLQSLWEGQKNGSKWATVAPYYFPNDLPEVVSRPSIPENREVYASNNGNIIMAGSIRGPCEVLPPDKFREECDRRIQLGDTSSGLHPIFMCKWLYDESKGIFQSVTN